MIINGQIAFLLTGVVIAIVATLLYLVGRAENKKLETVA